MALFIAICDDEKNINAELEHNVISVLNNLCVKHSIDVFYTGSELRKALDAGTHYDLIFLDIEFPSDEVSGLDIGKLIRDVHRNDAVSIVYISWENKYSMQLFETQPLHFLVKPLDISRVEGVMKKHMMKTQHWLNHFTYKLRHEFHKVQIKDISYLESSGRKLILHLSDGRKNEFYGSLREVYSEQLRRFDFLYISSSFAVNFDFIEKYRYEEVLLRNVGTPLLVSQRRRKTIKEEYGAIIQRRMN